MAGTSGSGGTETVLVPNSMVGLVIGKGGECIRDIQVFWSPCCDAVPRVPLIFLCCVAPDAHRCSRPDSERL
jgi:KH domain